jgi:hypothetical protein
MAHDTPIPAPVLRLRAFALTAAFLLAAESRGLAQDSAPRPWNGSIQGTGALFFGNTEQLLLSGRGYLAWADRTAEVTAELQTTYGESGDGGGARSVTRRTWIGSRSITDLEYLLSDALSLTANLTDSYDSEAKLRGAPAYNDGQLTFGFRAGW